MRFFCRLLKALVLFAVATVPIGALAQDIEPTETAGPELSVFLDCNRCDDSYILTEIDFINFVRDRTAADLHLLITQERTGSGSRYSLNYIGLRDLATMSDTLYFNSSGTDTQDERREGLANVIKLGLVRYIAQTEFADRLVVGYTKPESQSAAREDPEDKWNAWVFSVSSSGGFNSEESRESIRTRSRVRANRITEDWKIRTSVSGNYNRDRFELSDTTIVSTNTNASIFNFIAKSLGQHWSVGGSTFLSTSSFDNTDLLVSVAPAIEYSIFPYSEFNRREFRIEYRLGIRSYDYTEETIFDKTAEALLYHEIETSFELRQPWGSTEIELDASQFLHDFEESKAEFFRVELGGEIDVRIVRGLSVSFGGEISWVRDQLFLPKEDATEEEILLGARSLPTAYEYGVSVGLSYTFGSIYNNVVNPRFGF